jgi:hypothetical protein
LKEYKKILLILQTMALSATDMNQVLNHLGHTFDVHRDYYRHYSTIGERLDIAKLLLIQDLNRVDEFKHKGLDQIDTEKVHQVTFRGN